MPILPDLELSQEHYDRVVAAFPGDTAEDKVNCYRNWLINHLIDRVMASEIANIEQQILEQRNQLIQAVMDSLPDRPPMLVDAPEPPIIQRQL